jgi:vacuolar-type H+-ATPase subunit D/Vma8
MRQYCETFLLQRDQGQRSKKDHEQRRARFFLSPDTGTEAMSDLKVKQALSLQDMSQHVSSMQENIASLGRNMARAQYQQTALLDQLKLLGQTSEPAVTDPINSASSQIVSIVEVNELDEQNRHIQLTLEQMRQAIQAQQRQLSGLTAAMSSAQNRAEYR